MPRHVDQPLAVGEGLLAGRPESDAGMRPHGFQQHGDGLGNRAVVAPDVKPPQELQGVGDLDGGRIKSCPVDGVRRIEAASLQSAVTVGILPKSKEGLVAEREERPVQGRKDPAVRHRAIRSR